MIRSFLDWLGNTPWSIALLESYYVWPWVESTHVLSLGDEGVVTRGDPRDAVVAGQAQDHHDEAEDEGTALASSTTSLSSPCTSPSHARAGIVGGGGGPHGSTKGAAQVR